MKLTLVQESSILLKYYSNEHQGWWEWASDFEDVTSPDIMNCQDNDFTRKKFLWSKINGLSKIRLCVVLKHKDALVREYLRIAPLTSVSNEDETRTRCNILKQLRETFGEKVQISVRMEPSIEEESDYSVVQEGLAIEEDCVCRGDYVRINLLHLNETRYDITVTAHISGDHELVRQSQEKIPVSLRMNRRILDEGIASDAVIISRNGKEIKCHKSFLIAASTVIRSIFETQPEESQTGRVDMSNLSEKGVTAFLRYIYCGDKIDLEADLNLAFELLYASHMYKVSKLEKVMIAYWMDVKDRKIGVLLALRLYMFVKNIDAAYKLKAKLVRILHRKYDTIQELPEYDDLEFCKALCESKGRLPKYDDLFKKAKETMGPPAYEEIYKTPSDAKELYEDLKKVFEAEEQ